MTSNVPELIARLEENLVALGDGRNLTSEAQKADHWTTCTAIRNTLSGLHNAGDVARYDAQIVQLTARRDAVVAKQTEIEQALSSAVDPLTIRDGRERDTEFERQRQLRLSLQRLRDGRLLYAPDSAYERLEDLDAEIQQVTARRERAQSALNSHVAAAGVPADRSDEIAEGIPPSAT